MSVSLYRIAALCMLLFAAGHTLGALVNVPSFSEPADGVLHAMRSVRFPCEGSTCSWFGFYAGFGAIVTLFLTFSAVLTWTVGSAAPHVRMALRPASAALCFCFIGTAIISFAFFFVQPLVLSSTIAALLAAIVIKYP